jgi:hypothetical protein
LVRTLHIQSARHLAYFWATLEDPRKSHRGGVKVGHPALDIGGTTEGENGVIGRGECVQILKNAAEIDPLKVLAELWSQSFIVCPRGDRESNFASNVSECPNIWQQRSNRILALGIDHPLARHAAGA